MDLVSLSLSNPKRHEDALLEGGGTGRIVVTNKIVFLMSIPASPGLWATFSYVCLLEINVVHWETRAGQQYFLLRTVC